MTDDAISVTDKLLLVQLSISQWTARKYDRRISDKITSQNQSISEGGRFNKFLLPISDSLSKITKSTSSIRQFYYDNTLPWSLKGAQLLPTANYIPFMTKYKAMRISWESNVIDFISAYPRCKLHAEIALGSMYDEDDYPHVDAVENKFNIDISVLPLPKEDFWVNLADNELDKVRESVKEKVENAQKSAMDECWNRLYEKVKHMADKLSQPDAIFKNSMVDGLGELCELLVRLNFTDDKDLDDMRIEVKNVLSLSRPDSLRQDPILRRDTASEAKRLTNKMSAYMAGN